MTKSNARAAAAGALLLLPGTALADVPSVVASIKPVHSLVAAVMRGVGEPALLLDANASPHTYALRPSDAARLSEADLVVWIGPGIESFLDRTLETLAQDSQVLELAAAPGLTLLPYREGGMFEAHDDEDHAGGEHPAHDDEAEGEGHDHEAAETADHAHDEIADSDAADGHDHGAEAGHDGHDHGHGDVDAHVWLDPANAALMADAIAVRLADLDPENAAAYRDNAAAEGERLAALREEIAAIAEPVAGRPFIVFHDAFQYFEAAFGVEAVASVTISPDVAPGARRIAELQARIEETGTACLVAEPQFPRELVDLLASEDTRIAVLDPIGVEIEAGPDLYTTLLRQNAEALAGCLADPA